MLNLKILFKAIDKKRCLYELKIKKNTRVQKLMKRNTRVIYSSVC